MTQKEKIMYVSNDIVRNAINEERYDYASFVTDVVKDVFSYANIETLEDFINGITRFIVYDCEDDCLERYRRHARHFIEDLKRIYVHNMFKD